MSINFTMDPVVKQNIDKYVTQKYTAEQQKIYEDARQKAAALPRLGIGNAAYSTYADERHTRIQADCVRSLVLKRAEIQLEAYNVYGAPPDDAIVEDARMLRDTVVAARSNAVAGELNLEVMRNVRRSEQAKAIAESFKRQLTIAAQYVVNEVFCLVEQRKAELSKKQEALPNISIQGGNPRVNINSVDQSHNHAKD